MAARLFWKPDLDCTPGRPCEIELDPKTGDLIAIRRFCSRHGDDRSQGRTEREITDTILANMRARNPQAARSGG